MDKSFLRTITLGGLGGLTTLAACSLANAPPEPRPGPGAGGGTTVTTTTTTTSSSMMGGGGSGAGTVAECGNGTVEMGEDCDDAGESATCDEDCSAVECGDALINVTAGEGCDDGNTDTGDACDDTCQPSVFEVGQAIENPGFGFIALQPTVLAVTTAQNEEGFVLAFSNFDADNTQVFSQRFTSQGVSVGMPTQVSNGTFDITPALAQNDAGAIMVAWKDTDANEVRYRMLGPDGLPTMAGGAIAESDGAGFNPVARPTPSGGFCTQWHDQTNSRLKIACFDGMGMPQGATKDYSVSDPSSDGEIIGATELMPFQGGFLSLFWSTPEQLDARLLDGNGNSVGSVNPIGTAVGWSWTAGVAPTGGTGFLVAWSAQFVDDDVEVNLQPMVSQTTPDGPPVNFTTASVQHVGYELIHNGGRFAFIYGETPTGTQIFEGCALNIQEIDASGQKVGDARTLVPLTIGACPLFADADVTSNGDVFVTWAVNDSTSMTARTEAMVIPGLLAAP